MCQLQVDLFTDGACGANGSGGWAYILCASAGTVKDSGYIALTTNNRAELLAAIKGLESLPSDASTVTVVTDSAYLADGANKWIHGWVKNGWRRKEGRQWAPLKNDDLWKRLYEQLLTLNVTFERVKGHAGHPENEECDRMAVAAYQVLRK